MVERDLHARRRQRQAKPGSTGRSAVSRRADLSADEARFLDVKIAKPAVKPKSKAEAEAIRKAVRQVLKEKPLLI
jgi:hypothetical protein